MFLTYTSLCIYKDIFIFIYKDVFIFIYKDIFIYIYIYSEKRDKYKNDTSANTV